jgi:probable rRNA maturation factor
VADLGGGAGVRRAPLRELVRLLAARALARAPRRRWATVEVLLLDEAGLRAANRAVFRRDAGTDVIALAYPPLRPADGRWTGEVLANVERAVAEGRRRGGADHELALYVAHGLDHLGGASDRTAAGARRMRRRELRWLREAQRAGRLPGLVRGT